MNFSYHMQSKKLVIYWLCDFATIVSQNLATVIAMEYGPYIVSELRDCNGYVILQLQTYMYTAAEFASILSELSDCYRYGT